MTVELLAGEKQRGETSKAIQACNDYLRMGSGRSLRDLAKQYHKMPQNATPTRSFDTLGAWSGRYDWQERAKAYDALVDERKTAEAEAVMQEGLALAHNRVKMLKELALKVRDAVVSEVVAKGKTVEVLDTATGHLLRGILDDIAKETGGRVSKQEVTGAGGGPIETRSLDGQSRDRAIASLADTLATALRADGAGRDGDMGAAE
jgi:hypothetical protein